MVDGISHLARTTSHFPFGWDSAESHVAARRFRGPTPSSLNRATVLLSPYLAWSYWNENTIAGWGAAASAVPYSEEVGSSTVDTLLRIASLDNERSYIPIDVWEWLKKQQSLPPVCWGRSYGTGPGIVRHVRGFADLDLLKSYFLLVWSEWNTLDDRGSTEISVSIVEDLSGIGKQRHRDDLIERLDHILGELDQGLEHFKQHNPQTGEDDIQKRKEQYGILRGVLVEVDRKAIEHLH